MNSLSQEIRPRRIWYVVAAIILALGIAVFAALLVNFITGITGMADSMTRVVAPGSFDIKLDKPGKYTIFHEYHSIVGNRVYNTEGGLDGLACGLTEKTTGRVIPVTPSGMSGTYTMGSYAGRSVFEFTIPSAGDYTLTADYPDGTAGSQAVITIGQDFMGGIAGSIIKMFAAVGALIVSILLSIVICVITMVRRSAAKRRLHGAVQ